MSTCRRDDVVCTRHVVKQEVKTSFFRLPVIPGVLHCTTASLRFSSKLFSERLSATQRFLPCASPCGEGDVFSLRVSDRRPLCLDAGHLSAAAGPAGGVGPLIVCRYTAGPGPVRLFKTNVKHFLPCRVQPDSFFSLNSASAVGLLKQQWHCNALQCTAMHCNALRWHCNALSSHHSLFLNSTCNQLDLTVGLE